MYLNILEECCRHPSVTEMVQRLGMSLLLLPGQDGLFWGMDVQPESQDIGDCDSGVVEKMYA